MRVLIGCECSGVIRREFRALGHDAWSCDIQPADDEPCAEWLAAHPEYEHRHFQEDVLTVLDRGLMTFESGPDRREPWDLGIFHPPCDFLTNSAAWAYPDPDFARYPGVGYHQRVKPGTLTGNMRRDARDEAAAFFLRLWNSNIKRIAIENPVGHMNTHPAMEGAVRQIVQPYQFGDDASKATCLWLKGLPPLTPTKYVAPRMVDGKPRWSNQTDSGQNRLSPSEDRAKLRAVTYPGIAKAMASQWSNL